MVDALKLEHPGCLEALFDEAQAALSLPRVAKADWLAVAQQWRSLALQRGHTLVNEDRRHDVFLALAAVVGDRTAWGRLATTHFATIRARLRTAKLGEGEPDELLQQVRVRLFVAPGPGEPARVLRYVGHDDLAGLLAVCAVRLRLNDRTRPERRHRHLEDTELSSFLPARTDLELEHIKARYGAELKSAFERAIAELAPRERTMMRMHTVEGLPIDALAQVFNVHRATAARQLARARESISRHVRAGLTDTLGHQSDSLQSVLRVVRSDLDLSLERVLAPERASTVAPAGASGPGEPRG